LRDVSDLKNELESLKIDRAAGRRSPWRWPVALLAPALIALLFAYGLRAREVFSATEVETVRAKLTSGAQAPAGTPLLTASGYVVARRKAVVSAKIQGRLAELRVEEGSRVRQDEVLARLESLDYEASAARAKAAIQRAEADLAENERQLRLATELVKGNVLAEDQRQAAESRVKIAAAMLAQARADAQFADAQLQNTVIRAPFAGVVVKKMAEVGESVAPIPPGVNLSTSSGAIAALADLDTLEVEADVAEANVAKLGDAQPAEVTVEAFPDRKYRAVLRQVIPTADRTKATVQVKVTILDKDKDLKPEMSAKVTFLEKASPASAQSGPAATVISVPKAAVATRDGRTVVFEVVAGKALLRGISAGAERQGELIVKDGLTGGETLVADPPESLKDGAAVRVKG
jgi:RND family efflux transporter MFP subunit